MYVVYNSEYYVNGHLMKMSISSLDGGSPVSLLSGQHIIKDIQMYYENAGNTGTPFWFTCVLCLYQLYMISSMKT